jgi:cobalamin-dependent methionine synthase I
MEKISWTDRVRNEEVLYRVKQERNILHTIKKWKANWIDLILLVYKHVIEGKIERVIEVTRRQGRRRKQLLNNLKETREYRQLKEEAVVRHLCITKLWPCHKVDYEIVTVLPFSIILQ